MIASLPSLVVARSDIILGASRFLTAIEIERRSPAGTVLYAILRNTVYVGDIVHNGAPFADFSH
jgi:hypothetical protein